MAEIINTPTAAEMAAWLEANPDALWHEFSEEFGVECGMECCEEWAYAACRVWDVFVDARNAKAKAQADAEAESPAVKAFEAANLACGQAYVAYLEASHYADVDWAMNYARSWNRDRRCYCGLTWDEAWARARKLGPYVEIKFATAKSTYETLRIAAKCAGRSFSERGKELSAVEVEQIRSSIRAEMDEILKQA